MTPSEDPDLRQSKIFTCAILLDNRSVAVENVTGRSFSFLSRLGILTPSEDPDLRQIKISTCAILLGNRNVAAENFAGRSIEAENFHAI